MVDPINYFTKVGPKPERLPLKSAVIDLSTGTDQSGIAAVTGKRIRVMGFSAIAQHATEYALFRFQSGTTSGTLISSYFLAPPYDGNTNTILPITEMGYFETATGAALGLDVVNQTLLLTVFYIEYTP